MQSAGVPVRPGQSRAVGEAGGRARNSPTPRNAGRRLLRWSAPAPRRGRRRPASHGLAGAASTGSREGGSVRDIVDGLAAWRAAGQAFAVATVVRTWRSAPRQPGAAMAVNEHGEVVGSVSGGCVEGAVYAA